MTFQNLNIKSEYRSKHIDVIENFYIPLFSNAILYRRAVGFFSFRGFSSLCCRFKKNG